MRAFKEIFPQLGWPAIFLELFRNIDLEVEIESETLSRR